MKEAVILAGGFGTRLRHCVSDVQKVMAPVGGRPFLGYILDDLINKGFDRFILAVSYKAAQISGYFGSSYKGCEIVYSEEDTPLGTGGAIRQAAEFCTQKNIAVINGDTFFDVDFDRLYEKHTLTGAGITVAVKRMFNFSRYGTVQSDNSGVITAFNEKQPKSDGYINGGIYIIDKDIFHDIGEGRFSFEKDIMEKLIIKTCCEAFDGFFIDIGIPSDYFSAQKSIPLYFGRKLFPAAFLDRDGVICREKHHLYKPEEFEFTDNAVEGIEKLREAGFLIIVISNQAGVAKGLYTERDIETLHNYMIKLIDERTYIDKIYYCPYHEDGIIPEYTKPSRDRKPDTGMIEKAVDDFRREGIILDLEHSVIIGDTENDIATGINAGIGTKVLVRSGHAINEENTRADIISGSLYDFAQSI